MKKLGIVSCLLLSVFASGCATSLKADVSPGMTFNDPGKMYVARFEPDKRKLNELIADQLNEFGYTATAGEIQDMPKDTDTLVTYTDHWFWDMGNYLLRLNVKFRDAKTEEIIVTGESYRTSLARKSPEYVIKETLEKILSKKA